MTETATAAGCSIKPAIPSRQQTISVNGVVIPRAAIARETQNHPAERPVEAWLAAARALVVRELLLQEARRLGVPPTPLEDQDGRRETDEEAMIRALVEAEVRTPEADEDACRRIYEANRRQFCSADIFEVRHILLPASPNDPDAQATALRRAHEIIVAARREPDRFAELAAAESACPSGASGGNLGQIGPGQTVPEFERALVSLPLGEVAPEPIETRYGFHVVMLERRVSGRQLPFELVHSRIAEWLSDRARRVAIRQYIAVLAGRAEVLGIDMGGSETPLVQ